MASPDVPEPERFSEHCWGYQNMSNLARIIPTCDSATDRRLMAPNPIIAEVVRGNQIESWHRGAAIVVDRKGRKQRAHGNVEQKLFPRSMIKPLQAVGLVSSGAADAFRLPPELIALAASSQFGEPRHVKLLQKWCEIIGVGPDDLQCGAHKPFNPEAT
jgi:L-asparaginase II